MAMNRNDCDERPGSAAGDGATPPWLHGGRRREAAGTPADAAAAPALLATKVVDLAAYRGRRRPRLHI